MALPKRVIAYRDYTTMDGDSFDSIAFKFYGIEEMSQYIIDFNIEYSAVIIFPAGIGLRLPIFEKVQDPRRTAPWKRKNAGTN